MASKKIKMTKAQKKAQYTWNAKNPTKVKKVQLRSQCKRYILKFADDADILQVKGWLHKAEERLANEKEDN